MKKLFKNCFTAVAVVLFLSFSYEANAQSYEVYDGEKFSVMFTVENEVAHDVKFAMRGAKSWADFEVLKTTNWEGKGEIKDCIFTFYVVDSVYNGYQIDYYTSGYIMVFQVDNETGKSIGKGWNLPIRQ